LLHFDGLLYNKCIIPYRVQNEMASKKAYFNQYLRRRPMSRFNFLGIFKAILVLSIIALFVGCGGGGGDSHPTTPGFAGTWHFTNHDDPNTCGGEAYTYTFNSTITTNGNQIIVTLTDEEGEVITVTGNLSGNTATVAITSDDEDEGKSYTETTNLTLTLSSDGLTITGEGEWSDVFENAADNCSGTFTLSGTKK
jgi:hypothetical protein